MPPTNDLSWINIPEWIWLYIALTILVGIIFALTYQVAKNQTHRCTANGGEFEPLFDNDGDILYRCTTCNKLWAYSDLDNELAREAVRQ